MAADKKTLQREVLKQVQAGKLDKAIETYRAIIKLDPKDAAVRNSLGDLLGKLGKKKDAIGEYQEAIALYEKDGFGPRAIAVCQKTVKLDPEQWGVRLKLGDLYAAQKLRAEARTIYTQLAERHDKRGEVSAALDMFRRIADLEPENLPVRVKLAGMFERQKQGDKAAEEYVRAAKGYAARNEHEASGQLLVRAFKLSPANLEARHLLADVYAQRQEWAVVVGLLETPVARGALDPGLIVRYAEALTQVNHAREAAALLEKLQAREPNAVPVNLALGRAYLKAGEVDKGAAALNRCVGAYLAENQLALAESLLQELSAAAPADDHVLQRIIEVAQKRGDAAVAAESYLKLVTVYEKKGLARNAAGALERYLENRPEDAVAAERLERLKSALPAPAPAGTSTPAAAAQVAPPPPAPDDELEIDLEEGEEDLAHLVAAGEEAGEELLVEGEEAIPAVPEEPTSVAAARVSISRGAAAAAAAFLEDHLGARPDDPEGWEALAEARRVLGSPKAARDALLRLADVHRRARRFEEARTAYKGALDLDHRSAAAARGLAALIIEEEEAHAETPAAAAAAPPLVQVPTPAPPPAAEELIEISLEDEGSAVAPSLAAAPASAGGGFSLGEAAAPPPPAAAGPEVARDETAPPVQAPPAPEEEYGEISLEEVPPAPGDAAAAPEGVAAGADVEPGRAAFPAELDEVSLDAGTAATGADEISLSSFDAVLADLGTADAPQPVALSETEVLAPAAGHLAEAEPEPVVEPTPEQIPAPTAEPTPGPFGEPILEPVAADAIEEVTEGIGAVGGEGAPGPIASPAAGTAPEPAGEAGTGAKEIDVFLAEADFYLQQGFLDEAEAIYTRMAKIAPDQPAIAAQLQRIREQRAAAAPPPVEAPADALAEFAAAAAPGGSGAEFGDFLGDLRLELEGQGDLAPPAPLDEAGLNEIFQEFQRSVKEQLGDEDFETHYNLGIAYKEMGLTEEAIGEFSLAEKSPTRCMDAVSMIALCLREQGRLDEAVQKLRTGIALAAEGSEQQKGFLYDLAALHEQAGRTDLANETLQRLHAIDPAYRDVAARIGAEAPPPAHLRKKPRVSYL